MNFLIRIVLGIVAGTFFATSYGQPIPQNLGKSVFANYISVPIAGNSWADKDLENPGKVIAQTGIENWENTSTKIVTHFWTGQSGKINLAVRIRVKSGTSVIDCQFGKAHKYLSVNNLKFDTLKIGSFKVDQPGYQSVVFSGTSKTSNCFAEISDLLISGESVDGSVRYVKDEFYWGRRGPSVHLNYESPVEAGEVTCFYNEITVPAGNDVLGSYFMANGFAEGYFGIQVNAPQERRILFSVWSPFKTDKPSEIPEDQKIVLLKKGPDVHAGEFGDEGSGGQSYRKYNWKSGTTYRFMLKGIQSKNNSTDFTAYFFAPEIGKWELIASFRRPQTNTCLKHLHSFLENFIPENGNVPRMAYYTNQWVCNNSGKWTELTKAKFTADATARKGARLDYSGGTTDGKFFLKNCGFFNEKTEIDTWFIRSTTNQPPKIDFLTLP